MKLYIRSSRTDPVSYNQSQTKVGSPLKTYKGSVIKRSNKYGVGKEIGGSIYVAYEYADRVIPANILDKSLEILESSYPDFEFNCVRYDPKLSQVSFQECPNFDTAREPKVGDFVTVNYENESCKTGHSEYIFHHKWLWVMNDYTGFDVAKSWNWSKEWLSTLQETSDGNGIQRWNAQLTRYGLPLNM